MSTGGHIEGRPQCALEKAMAASLEAARIRLRAGASQLKAAIQADGVVFNRTLSQRGRATVRVMFCWPGRLMVLCPQSGEIIRETFAVHMHAEAPAEAAFLGRAMKGRALAASVFQPPQGARLRATFGADGVVRVHAVKGGELLAESEPGQPTVLRAGFTTLTPQDLAPRLS